LKAFLSQSTEELPSKFRKGLMILMKSTAIEASYRWRAPCDRRRIRAPGDGIVFLI
jgi:hypothetical protein